MYRLTNPIRPYAWGSRTAISSFFGIDNKSSEPQAELWIGAHPGSPSQVIIPGGQPKNLDTLLSMDPDTLLGAETMANFGNKLPFLMKVLAADSALSLQVHPNKEQAQIGFDRENAMDLVQDHPQRNYKDDNHKPEMIIALTNFEALCGFQDPVKTGKLFHQLAEAYRSCFRTDTIPELLQSVLTILDEDEEPKNLLGLDKRLKLVFESIISHPQSAELTETTITALRTWLQHQELSPGNTESLKTVLQLHNLFPRDPGVLLSLLLNRVSLAPGEALFIPAGNVHAYLTGLGIEVMASSDNVLRGGLTTKHIDTAELLKSIDFKVLPVPLLTPLTTAGQRVFKPPFKEFQVQETHLFKGGEETLPLIQHGPVLVFCAEGKATLKTSIDETCLNQAESVFIGANEAPIAALLPDCAEQCRLFAVTPAE